MHLYYFGNSDKPLFGVHHAAQGNKRRNDCIVLCPPIGTEYLRSYRAFRQLATMLSKDGFDVLRFDYYGTGDSSGDCEDGSLTQWVEDIATAIDELKEVSDATNVSLVGLRIGGTLAAAASRSEKISRLILWEPVTDGEAYLENRIQADLEYETETNHEDLVSSAMSANQTIGIMGFAWAHSFREEVKRINIDDFRDLSVERTFLLVREENTLTNKLREILAANDGKFGYQHIEHPGEWGEFDAIGSLLLPQATIKAVVACLT